MKDLKDNFLQPIEPERPKAGLTFENTKEELAKFDDGTEANRSFFEGLESDVIEFRERIKNRGSEFGVILDAQVCFKLN